MTRIIFELDPDEFFNTQLLAASTTTTILVLTNSLSNVEQIGVIALVALTGIVSDDTGELECRSPVYPQL